MRKITDLVVDVLAMAMFVAMIAYTMLAIADFDPQYDRVPVHASVYHSPPGTEAGGSIGP
jgi:hypothetical protein